MDATAGQTSTAVQSVSTDYLRRAAAIAGVLIKEAQPQPDGSITWYRGYAVDFTPVRDAGIFNGRIGEALFFAYMYDATRDPAYARASLLASYTLRMGLADASYRRELVKRIGIGLTGIGSLLYALVQMGRFLERPEMGALAAEAASALAADRVEADAKFDVFWGAAGAILGLLAVDATGGDGALPIAVACGNHLLAKRVADRESGLRAWNTTVADPWTGFAHGSSGIAYALLRIYDRTDDRRFYDAALESIAFERELYRADIMDWPDSRAMLVQEPFLSSWCHGAPGIALARLYALRVLREEDQAAVVKDLDAALTRTAQRPVTLHDGLCCGNFGRALVLDEAGSVLGNESLHRQAHWLVEACLTRADQLGSFALSNSDKPHWRGGLWQGLTGIGYALLKLHAPDRYPDVLTLA